MPTPAAVRPVKDEEPSDAFERTSEGSRQTPYHWPLTVPSMAAAMVFQVAAVVAIGRVGWYERRPPSAPWASPGPPPGGCGPVRLRRFLVFHGPHRRRGERRRAEGRLCPRSPAVAPDSCCPASFVPGHSSSGATNCAEDAAAAAESKLERVVPWCRTDALATGSTTQTTVVVVVPPAGDRRPAVAYSAPTEAEVGRIPVLARAFAIDRAWLERDRAVVARVRR